MFEAAPATPVWELKNISKKDIRSKFNYTLQDSFLFQGSIKDNINYIQTTLTNEQYKKILKNAALSNEFGDETQDYKITEKGDNISGGQRRRIYVARAFTRPGLLTIMDEPLVGISENQSKEILQHLIEHYRNGIFIFSTHQNEFIQYFDRIIEFGKITVIRDNKEFQMGGIISDSKSLK